MNNSSSSTRNPSVSPEIRSRISFPWSPGASPFSLWEEMCIRDRRGLVELDTPVVQYVPDFKMLDEDYKKITVRHLLNHASGLPGTQWKGFSVTALTERDYYQEVLDYLAISHLKAKPGEYSVYCNDGFTLAEIVVARVSGQRYSCLLYTSKSYRSCPPEADERKRSSPRSAYFFHSFPRPSRSKT